LTGLIGQGNFKNGGKVEEPSIIEDDVLIIWSGLELYYHNEHYELQRIDNKSLRIMDYRFSLIALDSVWSSNELSIDLSGDWFH